MKNQYYEQLLKLRTSSPKTFNSLGDSVKFSVEIYQRNQSQEAAKSVEDPTPKKRDTTTTSCGFAQMARLNYEAPNGSNELPS